MKAGTWVILIMVGILVLLGLTIYQENHVWSDSGAINWIGQKTYADQVQGGEQWVVPYSIQTMNHGVLNFTARSLSLAVFCGNSIDVTINQLKLGILIGVTKLQCGGYDLVVDP